MSNSIKTMQTSKSFDSKHRKASIRNIEKLRLETSKSFNSKHRKASIYPQYFLHSPLLFLSKSTINKNIQMLLWKKQGFLHLLLWSDSPCMEYWNNNRQLFSPIAKVHQPKNWVLVSSEFGESSLGYSCLFELIWKCFDSFLEL